MKKALTKVLMLTLCIALALCQVSPAFAATTSAAPTAADVFDDVAAGAWYEKYIDRVYSEGLMFGTDDHSFGVSGNLTRGQLATIIYRIAGEPEFTGDIAFTDVPASSYATAIAWAYANGIVTGGGNGKFGPEANIKRADLVVMLWRYAKFAGYDVRTTRAVSFKDANTIPAYAADAVNWAVNNGIISGYADSTFRPNNLATRMEIAKMVAVFLDISSGTTFDLETVCTDDGQPVAKAIVHLEKPVNATAEELKDAFTVTVKDLDIDFYGFKFTGDLKREITDIAVSNNGKTVELTLAITGVEFPASLAMKSNFADYGGWYEIKVAKAVGSLTTDLEFAFTERISDPVADKWGAKDVDAEAGIYAYRWFDPSKEYKKPEKGYPLVVWLHGAGEVGEDNDIQITANRVTAWGQPETQELFDGAYVLAPQCSFSLTWGWTPDYVMNTIEAFIARVGEENVDRDRIVIGGCSMGGMGTWATLKEYPDYFAAAFPTCGAVQLTKEDIYNLMDLPIYLIHTVEDGTVNIEGSLSPYDAMTAAGKENIYLALYEHTWTIGTPDSTPDELGVLAYNGHSSWIYTHNDFDGVKEADKYFMTEYKHTFKDQDGNETETKTYTNTKPSELGYKSFKAWLAAQTREKLSTATFNLETVCTDDGQPVAKVIIHHLEKPVNATAEEFKDAFAVTVKDLDIDFYGFKFTGDLEREVTDVAVSEDGISVELTLALTGVEFPASLAMNSNFANYGGWYEVEVAKAVGSLTTDLKLTYSKLMTDPVADKWGKVAPNADAGTYGYRWFDPSKEYKKPEKGYPLVVWLHGAGEVGEDNDIQITANRVTAWGQPETQELFDGAYVIAPQCNPTLGFGGWGWQPANVMKTIEAFIAQVGEKNIDRDRIVIGGCSMGGMGTWATLKEYPDYFAAAFPTCGAVELSDEDIQNLMGLPIYLIHTVEDGTVNITGSLSPYDAMTAAGKENIYLALYEHTWTIGTPDSTPEELGVLAYNGHSSWIYTHNDFDGVKEADKYFMTEYKHTFKDQDGNETETKTYTNTKPSELGYKSFKAWLAGQSK